jgi:hypothetical protein
MLQEMQWLLSDPHNPELYPHRAALLRQRYRETMEPSKPTSQEDVNAQRDWDYGHAGSESHFQSMSTQSLNLLESQQQP